MPKTVKSIRERIMETLVARLEAMGTPSYTFKITSVERRNIELPEQPNTPSIYIYEGDETKDSGRSPNSYLCTLPIAIVYLADDADPSTQLTTGNSMLEDVTRIVGADFIVADENGKTQQVDMEELTNEVITGDQNNSLIYVGVQFEVQYYHKRGDQSIVQ